MVKEVWKFGLKIYQNSILETSNFGRDVSAKPLTSKHKRFVHPPQRARVLNDATELSFFDFRGFF